MSKSQEFRELEPGKTYDFHLKRWVTSKNVIVPEVTIRRIFMEICESDGLIYLAVKKPGDQEKYLIALEIISKMEEYENR